MLHSEEKALEVIQSIAQEGMSLKRQITGLAYRADYQDYQVILDKTHHCEIREKLVDAFIKSKDQDVRKEIIFRLENPTAFEEWEMDVPPDGSKRDESVIDDPNI